jgi:hypothetical protein
MANTLKFGNGQWATGNGTALAYNDENANFKPLPFDFTRASSGTVVNQSGLIETVGSGIPRIDFQGNTKGALLLEPSRTNLIVKSENIQDWNKASNASAEFGYEDPFKGNRAVKLTSSSNAQSYQVYQGSSGLSSGTTYTYSMYAKKGTGYIFRLDFGIPDNGFVHIDLRDGSVLQESGSVYYIGYKVESISNGWYRISMIATYNSSAYIRAGLYQQQGDCYVAFAQLEAGSYATSYIPTSGSTVTRVADSCLDGGNEQVINSTEGVLYAEISALANDLTQRFISLSDGTSTNRLILGFDNSSNRIISFARVGGALSFNIIETVSNVQSYNKIAIKWKENDFALWSNGVELGIDTSGASFPSNVLNTLKFSDADGTTEIFNGNVKDIKLYNTALSDSELASLTQV